MCLTLNGNPYPNRGFKQGLQTAKAEYSHSSMRGLEGDFETRKEQPL